MSMTIYNLARQGWRAAKKAHRNNIFMCASRELSYEENVHASAHNAPQLSKSEIDSIYLRWRGLCANPNVGLSGFRVFKMHFGFSAEYVPFGYFFPWMIRVLNPIDAARAFAHKVMAYSCFRDIPLPILIVKRIHDAILESPGIFFEQLANGRPAFGSRFDEVLDYVRSHPLPLLPLYNQLA